MSEENGNKSSGERNTAYLLIGAGVIFLLVNVLNISLASLWPLILIALGVYLLLGRNSIGSSAQSGSFRAPLESATAADVDLHLSVGEAEINALADSDDLINADLHYVGEINFEVTGAERKQVKLSQTAESALQWINPANWFGGGESYHWQIGLSPGVPMDLDIHSGVGEANLKLGDLKVTNLRLHGGAGRLRAVLPASAAGYPSRVSGGVGEVFLTIPANTSTQMEIKGGVGEITVETDSQAALRVKAHGGIGDVSVPPRLRRISGGDSDFELGKSGVWESEGFDEAETQIVINYQGGVGSLKLR